MTKHILLPIAAALLFFSVPAVASTAIDECPPRPESEEDQRTQAGEWFAKGEEYTAQTDYEKAVGAFLCSMRLVEHSSTLHNVLRATELGEDKALIAKQLRTYLVAVPNGEYSTPLGHEAARLEQQLIQAAALITSEPEPVQLDRGLDWRTPAYISFGAAGTSLIAGFVFLGLAISNSNEADSTIDRDTRIEAEHAHQIYQTQSAIGFVLGGLLAGAGTVMYMYQGHKETKDNNRVDVSVAPMGRGLSLSARF